MPLFARRNIRIISSFELLFPWLEVERIEFVTTRMETVLEFVHLENGMRYRTHELLFREPVDDGLLIAMRLEAHILAAGGEPRKRR